MEQHQLLFNINNDQYQLNSNDVYIVNDAIAYTYRIYYKDNNWYLECTKMQQNKALMNYYYWISLDHINHIALQSKDVIFSGSNTFIEVDIYKRIDNIEYDHVDQLDLNLTDYTIENTFDYGKSIDANFRYKAEMQDRSVLINHIESKYVKQYGLLVYAAIYDGHQSRTIADYAATVMYQHILQLLQQHQEALQEKEKKEEDDYIEKFHQLIYYQAYYQTSQEIIALADISKYSGSTASCILIMKYQQQYYIHALNVGDSRMIITHKNLVFEDGKEPSSSSASYTCLSYDHTATDQVEQERVSKSYNYRQKQHNQIINNRLGYCLAVTRALGDRALIEYGLIDTPYSIIHKINFQRDEYLILASDGIWNYFTNDQMYQYIDKYKHIYDTNQLSEMIIEYAAQAGSRDNLSCILIQLRPL